MKTSTDLTCAGVGLSAVSLLPSCVFGCVMVGWCPLVAPVEDLVVQPQRLDLLEN